jgi:hypothetical protein
VTSLTKNREFEKLVAVTNLEAQSFQEASRYIEALPRRDLVVPLLGSKEVVVAKAA